MILYQHGWLCRPVLLHLVQGVCHSKRFTTIFSYNGVNSSTTTSDHISLQTTVTTYSLEPTSHAGLLYGYSGRHKSINLAFSAASTITNANGYIILRRQTESTHRHWHSRWCSGSINTHRRNYIVTTITSTATLASMMPR